jgi:hypothetical protein
VDRHKQLLILIGEVRHFRKPAPAGPVAAGTGDDKPPVLKKKRD